MLTRSLILAGLAGALLSSAALADSVSSTTNNKQTTNKPAQTQQLADRCAALETQFDQAIGTHGNAPKAATAKQLRTKGENLCKTSHEKNGIKSLQQALKDLGLKPQA
jgi:uncharacterized protein YyaL (SSP411 family)